MIDRVMSMVIVSEFNTEKIFLPPYFDCCENPTIIRVGGILTCKNCGITHEPIMKGSFSNPNSKVHSLPTVRNQYLTYGSRTTFTVTGLPPKRRLTFQRLAKLNNHIKNSNEGNMRIASKFLLTVVGQLEIPKSIQNFASYLYKRVVDARLVKGRSIKEMVVACLYIACNLKQYPRHISDFVSKSLIQEKKIRKAYTLVLATFKLRLINFSVEFYLEKYHTELDLPPTFKRLGRQITKLLATNGINTMVNSRGFAAAIIYFASRKLDPQKRIRQKTLSKITKVTELTIRKYVKEIDKIFCFEDISSAAHLKIGELC